MAEMNATVNVIGVEVTIRDYFAAAALQGMLAGDKEAADYPYDKDDSKRDMMAKGAYRVADAMLKAREQ